MLERPRRSVNCPNGQVFPIRNPEAGGSAPISTALDSLRPAGRYARRGGCKACLTESELHPQGPLDHARSPAYHACGSANCGSRATTHGRRDLAEVLAALIPHGVTKLGVVEKIKEARADPKRAFSGPNRKPLATAKL